MGEQDDRRRFPRISSRCVVDLRPVDPADETFEDLAGARGVMQNISGGGVCLRASDDHPVGSHLALKMHVPEIDSPILALGRVAWITDTEAGPELGVEFWWVGWEDPAAQESIRSLLSRSLLEP